MSADEFEKRVQRHVEFMLEQQARFEERQAQYWAEYEARQAKYQAEYEARQAQSDERLNRIEEDLRLLTGKVLEVSDNVSSMQSQLERTESHLNSAIDEMREGFKKLITLNELTHNLIEKVTLLTIQNSQRLTSVEQRVDNLEEKSS